jgi:hypothetical protein
MIHVDKLYNISDEVMDAAKWQAMDVIYRGFRLLLITLMAFLTGLATAQHFTFMLLPRCPAFRSRAI